MSYVFVPGRMYRMPTHFGPSPGPRQGPDGKRFDWSTNGLELLSLQFASERAALEALLPPRFSLLGDPLVTVTFAYLSNLPWLAGRGYNTLGVQVPVLFEGRQAAIRGALSLVLWENMAEPITTGREELGIAKIFCDIPPALRQGDGITCRASWDSFRFIGMELFGLEATQPSVADEDRGEDGGGSLLHYKYLPKTGAWGSADTEYVTVSHPPTNPGEIVDFRRGSGSITFGRPRWEDMPTQFHIVNALADLPCLAVVGTSAVTIRGGEFDWHSQSILS